MGSNASGSTRKSWFVVDRHDWLTFDQRDYLATKIVLGIAVAGAVLLGLGRLVVGAVTNAPLPVSYTTTLPDGMTLPRGATLDGYATMRLLLNDATPGERLGQAIPGLLVVAMTIAVAWLLFRLLCSIQAAEPFTSRNVCRVNTIALIVGLGGSLVQLAQGFADSAITTSGRLPGSGAVIYLGTFTPLPLGIMLVIALVGEAFRRGVVLRRDVEGLV